jgi:excisionase family DNA binding protein
MSCLQRTTPVQNEREILGISESAAVLTIEELSAYLKVPKSTLYKLVREGKVPCQKVGRHWRFHRSAIDIWLKEHPEPSGSAR